jgi:hypothetical protein
MLDCRLLCAAEQSYGSLLEMTHDKDHVGWRSGPVSIERGTDAVLIGRIDEGIVLAFRGTRPPALGVGDADWITFLDWLRDAECVYDAAILYPNGARPFAYPGNVHYGFARAVDRLWHDLDGQAGIETVVTTLLSAGAPRKIHIVGHSKGGPLAVLCASRTLHRWDKVEAYVVTIAGARAGDAGFRAGCEALKPRLAIRRYEAPMDIVPYLPPGEDTPGALRGWVDGLRLPNDFHAPNYVSIGDPGAAITPLGMALDRALADHLGRLLAGAIGGVTGLSDYRHLLDALLPDFVKAHLINDGSAYSDMICPGGEARKP